MANYLMTYFYLNNSNNFLILYFQQERIITMPIDLSTASDDGLTLILLRVSVRDLIGKCTQVSPQWNRILFDNFFWRKKMEYYGYVLKWPKLVGLSLKSFQWMALKHCFERNFIKDLWNFEDRILTLDPRWEPLVNIDGDYVRIEIPPNFLDGQPKIPPGFTKPIAGCIAIPNHIFTKYIVIKLADEGLTDEIMDNYRPTIIVTEMVGNRRDCDSLYAMTCSLEVRKDEDYDNYLLNEKQLEIQHGHEYWDENGRWVGMSIQIRFKQSEAERWHKVEYAFKDYPAGMRYLKLYCEGFGCIQNGEVQYGIKLANCSVKALCEKNAK